MYGQRVTGTAPPDTAQHLWQCRKPRLGVPGVWLKLDAPTCAYPGNLANTGVGGGGNNVKSTTL